MKKNLAFVSFVLAFAMLFAACSAAPPARTDAAGTSAPAASQTSDGVGGMYATAAPAAPAPAAPAAPAAATAPSPAQSGVAYDNGYSGESYLAIQENAQQSTQDESMLTFSLKIDTASYSNVQRYIEDGSLPPRDAVRTEELVNYFSYEGVVPVTDGPFGVYTEVGPSPFTPGKYMAFIRVKSRDIPRDQLPPSNLTFLIDTSGSMSSYDKLPLLKDAFAMFAETLGERDRVSIVTYAGSSAVLLEGVSGADKRRIIEAMERLEASGSTAGADGIRTAYSLAERNFIQGGNNRVILASDGDFNVGISSVPELEKFISGKRDSGVYLSVLGFGTGNIRDDIMETLAKNGNGNYSYINSRQTANKVLVNEMAANMFAVADDVKAQVEFNPQNVRSYRLVGYENRALENRDFADDSKDAGEIGVGTDVVVMFEMELQGASEGRKYTASTPAPVSGEYGDELFEVRLRYKDPGESASRLITKPVRFDDIATGGSSDYLFACSVAAFGHLLRGSEYAGNANIDSVTALAQSNLGGDAGGYRRGFLDVLARYSQMIARR